MNEEEEAWEEGGEKEEDDDEEQDEEQDDEEEGRDREVEGKDGSGGSGVDKTTTTATATTKKKKKQKTKKKKKKMDRRAYLKTSKTYRGSVQALSPPGAPNDWTGFDPLLDGTPQSALSSEVVIISDEVQRMATDKLVGLLMINRDRIAVGHSNYKMQFANAVFPGGYESFRNKEHLSKPACLQCIMWFMHVFTVPWKVLFAIVPPTDMCGGYLAFLIALVFIAVLTMLISDLSSMFGCIIGFDPAFTAITFVALGTSLPDLFASRSAAINDKYADNSIGNITGSNSVNVFLGLGLPWFIASIYWNTVEDAEVIAGWEARFINPFSPEFDRTVADYYAASGSLQPQFVVKAGNLVFSVAVFCLGALVCLVSVELRRCIKCCGNVELGGPTATKWFSGIFFIVVWLFYIALSWLNLEGYIPNFA